MNLSAKIKSKTPPKTDETIDIVERKSFFQPKFNDLMKSLSKRDQITFVIDIYVPNEVNSVDKSFKKIKIAIESWDKIPPSILNKHLAYNHQSIMSKTISAGVKSPEKSKNQLYKIVYGSEQVYSRSPKKDGLGHESLFRKKLYDYTYDEIHNRSRSGERKQRQASYSLDIGSKLRSVSVEHPASNQISKDIISESEDKELRKEVIRTQEKNNNTSQFTNQYKGFKPILRSSLKDKFSDISKLAGNKKY